MPSYLLFFFFFSGPETLLHSLITHLIVPTYLLGFKPVCKNKILSQRISPQEEDGKHWLPALKPEC